MLFHEYAFLFAFLPVTLAVYYVLPAKARNTWLMLANLVFYATSGWSYLPVLLFTIGVDYLVGVRIARASSASSSRRWLLVSLISNLGALGYFKYIDFLTSNL